MVVVLGERTAQHLADCAFGPGFWRVTYRDRSGAAQQRWFQTPEEADAFARALPLGAEPHGQRDACLDATPGDHLAAIRRASRASTGSLLGVHGVSSDETTTPDTITIKRLMALPKAEAMAELGLRRDADYDRVMRAVEGFAAAAENRSSQGGVTPSLVIRRKKTRENASLFRGGKLFRIGPVRH